MQAAALRKFPAVRALPALLVLLLVLPLLSACGFNTIPTAEEKAKAAWSEVLNQYQRRADLIPNLVETVKGYASHEKEVLEGVIEARAKATQVTVSPETLSDPEAFKKFQESQSGLTGALGRLLAIVENYPDLKANQNFLALQAQLEGTENRIAVARRDYIEAVREYNTTLRTFPSVLWASLWFTSNEPFQNFTVERRQDPDTEGRFQLRRAALATFGCPSPMRCQYRSLVRSSSASRIAWLPSPFPASAADLPKLTGRVVDTADMIDPASEAALVQKLAAFQAKGSDQVVVATIDLLDGEAIEPYANRLFRAWGLGQAGEDNGILLLVAKSDRKMRIEVGYGLEGTLTDLHSKLIIENTMVPAFRAGDFSGGISRAADDIIMVLEGNAAELEARGQRNPGTNPAPTIWTISRPCSSPSGSSCSSADLPSRSCRRSSAAR